MRTTISNSKLSATINHYGAELISLQKISPKREYIWEGNPEFWGKHSPILFPIVGTLKNNAYQHNKKEYKLSRHGFAREMEFDLVSHSENQSVFSLKSNSVTKELYPFDFELHLIYTLTGSNLGITYKVFNKSHELMCFSIGGHPAFALQNDFEEYSLQFEASENLISYKLENDLLSDKTVEIDLIDGKLPLNYSLFENDALIFKKMESKQVQLLQNNIPFLNFKFADFPNFGIWTKKNAPFICLEPWAGYSDVLNASGSIEQKEGIQVLETNSSKEYGFSIEIL